MIVGGHDGRVVALLDILLPPACVGCGVVGRLLCEPCVTAFEPPLDPRDRFVAADPGALVGDGLVLAIGAFAYRGPLRRALAQLKYEGARRIAPALADAAAPAFERLLALSRPATLVPIPIHPERRRARGYNQAELLAVALARRTGSTVSTPLVRVRPTTKQHELGRAARLANLRRAFDIARGAEVPRVAILVDDIVTTGATLEACAEGLVRAGAEAVYGFGIAREV